jgi:hypothetical protein
MSGDGRVKEGGVPETASLKSAEFVYGPENFWSPVQKDFCNNIGTNAKY